MSRVRFQETELNIIAMYEATTVLKTIYYMEEAIKYTEEDREDEVLAIMKSAVHKLKELTEEEFKALDVSKYLLEEDVDE